MSFPVGLLIVQATCVNSGRVLQPLGAARIAPNAFHLHQLDVASLPAGAAGAKAAAATTKLHNHHQAGSRHWTVPGGGAGGGLLKVTAAATMQAARAAHTQRQYVRVIAFRWRAPLDGNSIPVAQLHAQIVT
jgi:hypothetical protein